ncbi:hypothetical protein Poly30_31220 [Planctomycetes bacterium Poly30]|uniref:Uncharacterized protein n=1 Tax=Saltatorellus ferox TaxID=2528018 RepID=A0A518EU28_9BACT|nr:hypothetical protein Poly30_31220 [Planctomycetes bacterium Poly30]
MFGKRQNKDRENAEFVKELSAQREQTQSLVDRYEAEVKTARSAVLAVGKAREERDEYRRVLAAAIATERRREAQVEALEQEQQRLEALATRELRAAAEEGARRKELGQRVESLEGRLTEELAARERAIGDVSDRAWAEREAARDELVRVVVGHREEVASALKQSVEQLAALETALHDSAAARSQRPPEPARSAAADARGLRARLLIGLGVASTLIVVALIPLAVLSVSDPERALFVHLASGLGPWHLIFAVVVFVGLAVACLTWAIRDLEAARPPADDHDRMREPGVPAVEEKELIPLRAAEGRGSSAVKQELPLNGTPRS